MSPRKSPAGVNLIEFLAVTVRKRCFWAILVVVSWALLAPAAWHSTAYGGTPTFTSPASATFTYCTAGSYRAVRRRRRR